MPSQTPAPRRQRKPAPGRQAAKRAAPVRNAGHALSVVQLSALENSLGFIVRWARVRSLELVARNAKVDVDRSSIMILMSLHRLGPMRLSDLAVDIGLDRSTISRQVAAAVRAGYVQKTDDAADARASTLTLTARGQTARQKLSQAWRDILLDIFATWSQEDQAQFGRLIDKMVEQLRGNAVS